MAAKSQKLTFQVTAESDQAKKALDQLDKQAKILEKGVEVPLTLEGAKEAAADLDQAAREAKALATILQHTEGMGNVAEDASRSAKELEGMAREAKKVESALKEVSDTPPPDPRAGHAAEQMDTLNRSATGAKSAMANLVGNSAQDFSSLLGPLGSVGVAIGQVAEYTTDAANEGGGLTAALKGAAGMVGPLAALSAGMLIVTRIIEDQKAKAAAQKKAVEDMTAAFDDSIPVVKDWADALDEGFSAGTLSNAQTLTRIVEKGLGEDNFRKTAAAIGEMGGSLDDLGPTLLDADRNFESFAAARARDAGLTDAQATTFARLMNTFTDLSDVMRVLNAEKAKGGPWEALQGVDPTKVEQLAKGLAEVNDQVDRGNIDKAATQWLDQARAVDEWRAKIDEARAAGEGDVQIAQEISQAMGEATRKREENARAAEEGARKTQEAGSILDQVGRQVVEAEDQMREATEKNTKAQDDWQGKIIDLPASVDDFASSVLGLADGITAQAKAGDEGAGSFEGYTKAAIDNRDAQRDVYGAAKDVIDTMGKQGATTDDLAAKTAEMAQQAYDLAIKNGLSEEAAGRLRDTILTVPTARSTEMTYAENNYGTMLDHRDTLQEDMDATVFFHGVLDRSVVNAVNEIRAAGGIPGPGMVAPAGAAVAPAAGLRAVGAPVPAQLAPMALGAPRAAAVTVPVPVVVNVNAGLVADTFQLQRAVVRSARSFQRLSGKRAA